MSITRRDALVALAALPTLARAAWPEKPLTFVVPFPPGGPADGYGRAFAQALGARLKQTVVVENKSGAGGVLGVQAVGRAAADGYTLGMAGSGASIFTPILVDKAPLDVFRDTTMLSKMVRTPNFLVVGPTVKAKTLRELVDHAKANPGKLTVASAGMGSGPHILAELFKQVAGVFILHVPYKGAAPALQDLMGGQVDMFFGEAPGVLPLVKAGKLRALMVTDHRRARWLPDVPHAREVGLDAVVADGFYGIVAPPNLPAAVSGPLSQAIADALRAPELAERFDLQGGIPEPSTPEQYVAYIKGEQARWLPVVRKSKIVLE